MGYEELCANFKPKNSPPFPDALRTADLKKGMLVVSNWNSRYVILEKPSNEWVKVLRFWTGYAQEDAISLADHGCEPDESGKWNPSNWLREVK